MTVVEGKLLGHPRPASVRVTATLVDLDGVRRTGYVGSLEGEETTDRVAVPDAEGEWSLDLTPNADIESEFGDTLWLITEGRTPDLGRPVTTFVAVPASGGPYWMGDLRTDPPGGAAVVSRAVQSVNGDTGAVVLTAGDVGADPVGSAAAATSAAATYTDSAIAAEEARADGAYEPAGAAAAAQTAAATYTDSATGPLSTDISTLQTDVAPARPKVTVTQWKAAKPYEAGHRGRGEEAPEHTMKAYSSAVAQGAKAIEVSCQLTSDGVLVCWHDTTLARMTNNLWQGAVADYTWDQIEQRIKVVSWPQLGPGYADTEATKVEDVLNRFLGEVVIIIEPKTNDAVVPLQNLLARYPIDLIRSTVIWKGYYQTTPSWAISNNLERWGYGDNTTTDGQWDTHESKWTMLGMPHTTTDQRLIDILNRTAGKDLMVWEVHRYSEVQRLSNLTGTGTKKAVDGYMMSNWAYLHQTPPISTSTLNTWGTKVNEPGMMGHANYDPVYAPKHDEEGGVFCNVVPNISILLGNRSYLTPPSSYRISFEMMLEGIGPAGEHCGLVFGRAWDDKYTFNGANQTSYQAASPGGYHLVFRVATGNMRLYRHTAGSTSGTPLNEVTLGNAETPTATPTAGVWMSFEIDVTPTQLILRRTDTTPDYVATYNDATYRGGFMHGSNGSLTSLVNKPHFRALLVTPL